MSSQNQHMDKLSWFESLVYSISQIILGLFFHPYQTMQTLVRDRVFTPLVLLPTLLALIAYLLFGWWLLAAFYETSMIFRLIYRSLFFFFLLWQLLLLYLWRRFTRAFSRQQGN